MRPSHILLTCLLLTGCGYDRFDALPPENDGTLSEPNFTLNELNRLSDEPGYGLLPDGMVLTGTVTSSDSAGNFYKSIVIQQDTTGVELLTGVYDNYTSFRRGQTVVFRPGGLTLERYNGMLRIGAPATGSSGADYIASEGVLRKILQRSAASGATEIPTLTVAQVQPWMAGRLIRVTGGAFTQGDLREWSGERTYSESRGVSLTVYTSPYAAYASQLLPAGEVDLLGIVTLYNGKVQLRLSSPEDVLATEESGEEMPSEDIEVVRPKNALVR